MIYFILHILFKEEKASSKLVGCIEESVDRLEDVLQQVQCEINGVQDKMEDIKIEVENSKLLSVVLPTISLYRLLELPLDWRIYGGSRTRWPTLPVL